MNKDLLERFKDYIMGDASAFWDLKHCLSNEEMNEYDKQATHELVMSGEITERREL